MARKLSVIGKYGTFSPLFIGEDSSITTGIRFDALELPFSPLFIGEDSSIIHRMAVVGVVRSFQSPLHRGRLFNLR